MYVFLSLSNNIPVLLISYRRTTIWNFLNIGPQNLAFKTSSHLRKTMSGKSWSLVKMGRHLLWRRGESKEYLQKTWSSMTSHLIFRYSCISFIPSHSLWEIWTRSFCVFPMETYKETFFLNSRGINILLLIIALF